MQKNLLMKAALVAALFLLLQLPLQMIDGLVSERAGRQREVVQDIAAGSSGRQVFAGPILTVPYVEEYEETVVEEWPRGSQPGTRQVAGDSYEHRNRLFVPGDG